MSRNRFRPHVLLILLALVPGACSRVQGDQDAPTRAPFELTPEEVRSARTLAERDLAIPTNPPPSERVVFIKIDLLPDSQAETTQRQVIVTHYRYRGDETILTTVDLNRLEVLNREILTQHPTALAPEEFARAESLARRDLRLQALFEAQQLRVVGRPLQASNRQDPLFGRRVVHLLLRQGHDYLTTPRVLVDLSTETVLVDNPADISK